MPGSVRFKRVRFKNFKALKDFSLTLSEMNVLVGPNNAGKSTIISAFRALEAGIQQARSKTAARVQGPNGPERGWWVRPERIPFSLENVHTDYGDDPASVTFELSNGNALILYFPDSEGCFLLHRVASGRPPDGPSGFRAAFPVTIGVVPVLGPVEHNERVLDDETVRRSFATHRASRQFRNYWLKNPDGFPAFREALRETWPGYDIEMPEILGMQSTLAMWCLEDRIRRELFWSGFGFQAWCRLLTHVVRSSAATILVMDEPEIYLHPDLQRRLVQVLRRQSPDILIATHSTDLVSEAEPNELVIVDKSRRAANRLSSSSGIGQALGALGSVQTATISQITRHRRVLFVEGDDFTILRQFAVRLGLFDLAARAGAVPLALGGFPDVARLRAVCDAIRQAVGRPVRFAGMFDRDYRADEDVSRVQAELGTELDLVHVHGRKEIENYLLDEQGLQVAVEEEIERRARRSGTTVGLAPNMRQMLAELTFPMKADVIAAMTEAWDQFFRSRRQPMSTTTRAVVRRVEGDWDDLTKRMSMVSGKATLGRVNESLQSSLDLSLTPRAVIDAIPVASIASELTTFLHRLEKLRQETVPE